MLLKTTPSCFCASQNTIMASEGQHRPSGPGVTCTGTSQLRNGRGSIEFFHSPFEEELGRDDGHLESHLGHCEHVLSSPVLGCHLYVFAPKEDTPWWTAVTMGLSGFTMPTDDAALQRCELVISLPQEIGAPRRLAEDEELGPSTFAAELVLWLASYVVRSGTLFKHGDRLAGNPFGGTEPPFEGTELASSFLQRASHIGNTFPVWQGTNPYTQEKETVNFYAVVPISASEYAHGSANGSDALRALLERDMEDPRCACVFRCQ
mmetsp:Transcript_18894/g.55447  ORF Transcript_18894/g.55447 Transcript_18894/m.55447 type:complete len:263 (-) Transcript_18894:122-910(-)